MANQRRKPRELMLTLLFTFLMFSAVFSSDSQKLLGICNYESSTDFCTINSSLLGKRPLQINGVGYIGSPVDQTVVMKYQLGSTSMATPGPAVTRDFAFKSDMSRGVLYYEAPSVSDLIGTTLGSKMSSFESEFYVQGPLINGDSALYSCDTSSKCTIKYSMARTPQINRIYPSIVYPTQKICFNVFTDYAAAESKLYYVSSKMGDYSMSFGMFDVYNQAEFNTWKDYQICAQASAAPAASSYDISVVSQDGAYLLTNFAKSYDGTTPYIVRMIPEIVSVSTNTLYKAGGGILTITGQGFDLKPSNNVVTVDDVSCTVFESTDSQIRCVLAEKTTTTTATLFVGGTGARVKEYYNVRKADLTDSAQPTRTSYFTDIDSRRNDDDNDPQYTRVVEAWFVPPQTGGYIFFASCDDSCVIELSNTDMDKSAKSTILSVGYNSWRNFWSPSPSSFYSAEQTLTAGKHYYMKVTHEEISGDDYVTVGVKINDSSTSKPTSFKGWKSIAIEPHHTFEKYEVLLPNNTSANFRLQFVNAGLKCAALTKSADIFQCTSSVCPCVSASFKATATEAQFLSTISSFFNSVKSYYGSTMTVTKETLDSSGAVTAIAADIANYKFTFVARYVLSSESSTATTIWSDATGVTATVTKTQSSTLPLSGKYVIKIPLSDSTIVTTDDISLDTYNGQITRLIYNVAPEYIGRIELKVVTSKYLSSNEGKELYYRIDQSPSVNLQIASSTTTPLTGGSITDPIEYPSTQAVAASNTPYYEAIPGTMVRSVETKPQISITTNGLLGACPLPSICDVTFIADIGQITSRTATTPYTQMTFSGTSIPNTELTYVSVGTIRRCDLDPSTPATSTSLKCLIGNMIAGSHSIVVQSKKGAIKNSSTLTNLEVNIVITSASPSTLSTSGGQVLTITGQFFPVSLTEANSFSDFAVTFTGGSKCYVTSVSSTSIVCTTPKSLPSSAKVTVAFNGKSTEYATAFTVTQSSQQVVSVDKPTICPVLKQDIVITVSSTPSSNPNDYTGIISNDKRSIYMRINKVDTTAKTLTARFPGSPTNDDYTVFVEYNGDRYQSSVTVSARSTITAIQVTTPGSSKTSISTTGGDTITITGTGFSTTLVDNQVVLGESTYAEIVSATSTQLVVRAGSYATPGSTEVKVFLKLSVESVCAVSGGCTLIYDSSQAPTLTSPNDVLMPVNGVVTISGSGFGSNAVGYIGSYAQQTISSTSTEIKISLTKMDNNEAFKLVVKTDTVYLPTVTVQTPLSPVLTSISPQSGSIGGEKITLSTIGIGMAVNSNFNVFYTSSGTTISVCDTITLVDSSTITCVTKKNVSVPSTTLTLSFTHKSSVSGSTSTVTLSCSTASNCAYQTTSSATPTISSLSQINSGTGLQTTISNFVFDSSYTIIMYYGGLAASTTTIASSVVSGTFSNGLPPGVVQVSVSFEKNNRLTFTSGYQQTISLSATINSPVTCSWAGGCTVAISQNSIKQGASAGDISVKVCGQTASLDLTGSTTNTLNAIVPVYATTHSLDLYKVQSSSVIKGTVTSVPANVGLLAFDGITTTMYASYTSDNCYVQVMFDSGKVGRLTSLKYYMNRMTDKQTNFVGKLKFQSSSDGTTWSDVFTADTYLREGWNTYSPTNALEFQYYRFFSATKGACQIGEIQLIGNVVEMTTATTKVCDVVVTAPGGQTQTFASQVTYSDAASSVVTSISPRYGTYKGGETVTFTGSGFSSTSSQISITIDGIACAITSSTSTQIQCTSGARPTVNSSPSTVLKFTGPAQNGYASMQSLSYKYANYWSDLDTWSGEYLPKDGDSVYIPVGQTLVVDSDSSPILKAVLIEGALIFAPNANPNHQRTFDAEYIYVSTNALLEIGTETSRYTSKLTITMHGTKESAQLPMYGNKGIFVRQGTLDIHGVERTYTWTELATTVDVGKNQITLNAKTDWSVGEEIVVAPTDFDRNHAEAFKITAVDNSGTNTVLTLNTTTVYKHYSGSTTFTANNLNGTPMTKTLEMRAEVGLLTRNVVYKGADDDSVARQYGAHIMLHSPGDNSLTGRISYIEIKQAGQAFQLGRYPIHFHMIGRVDNSYVKGNAIHHTYNRACTIHGVHYLTLESNVAYETMGHTFFVEDAVETKNLLKNNLVVKTKISWSLLNSDQTPASFWITHPDNMLIGNHAAGSDKYGFWFDPQPHPTGPSYTENTCPEYEQLGEFTGNVAHSNGRYGLRIFHRLTPVTNPCKALAGGAYLNKEQPDPTVNVPIVTHFRDFVSYKNMRTAIMVEEGGALKFHNIRAADNVFSGVEMGKMAVGPWLTSSDDYHLQDALIVGASENYETESQYPGVDDETSSDTSTTCGVKGARSEKFRVKDVLFANFADPTWAAIATCSHCDGCDTDSSSRTYFFKNLFFYNVTRRVGFDTPFKEIIYDEDGSLGNSTHRWVVHYFSHLDIPECIRNEAVYNGLLCSKDISIRRFAFHHPIPDNALKGQPIKILNLRKIPAARRQLVDVSPSTCPSASSTLATFTQWDTSSFTTQQSLLKLYDQYNTAYNTYKTNLNLAESTNSQSAAQTAATAKTTMDAISPQITPLESQLEPSKGLYDNLYKTDVNFCNTNNYQNIDFRPKANPLKNLVFPIATGYEYHVHLSNGQDFNLLNGQYSQKELLDSEDRAIILHFNHTERAEAFWYNYTDSTANKMVTVTPQTSQISLTDTSVKIGDFYMNNVTRHMMMKFDGLNSDRNIFTLERVECISVGGCNNKNMPEDTTIETEYRYWSKPASWATTSTATGVLPKEGEDVIIQSTWNMVLDLTDTPVFRSIEINGRLTILNDGKTYNLHSYLIYVRKGELIVGTSDKPITGKVIFTLHGTRADKDIYFTDKMFEAGNKVIANTGLLNMYGKHVTTKWTRLAQTAPKGQNWILLVDDPTDWAVGDELGITPSGRDYTQRDFCVVQAINGKNVTIAAPLVYTHFGAAAVDATKTGTIDIRAEVLHLTRNIVVQGTNEDRWGAHVVTAHNNDSGFSNGQLVSVQRKGFAIIDHVEFVNCSQYDTDKAAVRFSNFFALSSTDKQSSVSNSAVHNGLGIGVMVTSANNVLVDNNVVFYHHIGGIWMKNSNSTTITNNVVGGMDTRYWSAETRLDELAGFNLCNKDQNCQNLIVKNNIVGGIQRIGFAMPTTSCTESSPSYENNLAHSCEHGAWIYKNNLLKNCEAFRNFKVYKTIEQGVLAYQGYNEIEATGIETLDCGRGIMLNIGAPFDTNKFRLKDSVFWGQTDLLPADTGSLCVEDYAIYLSSATMDGKLIPEIKLSRLPYEKLKSFANYFIEFRASNIKFKNWDSGFRSCDSTKYHRLFGINQFNADNTPVHIFDQVEFVNVNNDAVAYLYTPPAEWAIIKDCGQFVCTGPLNTILKFSNAKASGSPVPNIPDITTSLITFQIIPNNVGASEYVNSCNSVTSWNAYLCKNQNVAQLVIDSLDSDSETRLISPINILSQSSKFNSTLNSFMDHATDAHYTSLHRLSRFPSIVQTNQFYEIRFTGTQPGSTKYAIAGGETGVDWLHLKIDFSQSRLFNVYANDVLIKPNAFDSTTNQLTPIKKTQCGENIYFRQTYIYEFYLTFGCTVKFVGQNFVEAMVRLQISYSDFFSTIGTSTFVDRFASVLGITQDTIRIVGVYEGSTVVYFGVTSPSGTSSANEVKALAEINDKINYQCTNGNLNLGSSVLACSSMVINSSGQVTTTSSGNYKKKEINYAVYIVLAFACLATAIAILMGIIKAFRISKAYKEIANLDTSEHEKADGQKGDFAENYAESKIEKV